MQRLDVMDVDEAAAQLPVDIFETEPAPPAAVTVMLQAFRFCRINADRSAEIAIQIPNHEQPHDKLLLHLIVIQTVVKFS